MASPIPSLPTDCLALILQHLPLVDRKNTYLTCHSLRKATLLATIIVCKRMLIGVPENTEKDVQVNLVINQCQITLKSRYYPDDEKKKLLSATQKVLQIYLIILQKPLLDYKSIKV